MLQLQHSSVITDFVNLYTLLAVIGVLVIALAVLCFTRGWVGLLVGLVLLLTPLAYGGYQAKAYYDSQHPQQLIASNAKKIQQWAQETYHITLSQAEAKAVASGTESFNADEYRGKVIAFGQTADTKQITLKDRTHLEAQVALLWQKDHWVLVSVAGGNGQYDTIPTLR